MHPLYRLGWTVNDTLGIKSGLFIQCPLEFLDNLVVDRNALLTSITIIHAAYICNENKAGNLSR